MRRSNCLVFWKEDSSRKSRKNRSFFVWWWWFFSPCQDKNTKMGGRREKNQLARAHWILLGSSTYVSEDTICAIHATTHWEILLMDRFEREPASQATQAPSSRNRQTRTTADFFKHNGQYRNWVWREVLYVPSLLLDPVSDSVYLGRGNPFVPRGTSVRVVAWKTLPATNCLSREIRHYKMMKHSTDQTRRQQRIHTAKGLRQRDGRKLKKKMWQGRR